MKLIRLAIIWFQIRALEATIDGQSACLEVVRDPGLTNRIIIAQIGARNDLRRLRKEWRELRGNRLNSWRVAI